MKSYVDKEYRAMLARAREKLITSDARSSYLLTHFKVSDTPPRGPEGISGHPGTPGPPNNKEIA